MPTPKSVVKINKNNVEYVSNVDAANYYAFELSRAALRDVGKLICKRFKDNFYNEFKKHTGIAPKGTKYKVYSSKSTKYPRVEVGLKGNKGFYAYYQEFGTSKTPKKGLLRKSAEENLPEIIRIESQYLSALSMEAERIARLVETEEDMDGGADED